MLFQCYEGEEHMLLRVTERIAFFLYDKKIIQKEDLRWCVDLFQKLILKSLRITKFNKYCKLYHIIFYRMLYRYASTSDFVFIEF